MVPQQQIILVSRNSRQDTRPPMCFPHMKVWLHQSKLFMKSLTSSRFFHEVSYNCAPLYTCGSVPYGTISICTLSCLVSFSDLSGDVLTCFAGTFPIAEKLPPMHRRTTSTILETALHEYFHKLLIKLVHS